MACKINVYNSPIFQEDKSACTGCGACANICAHDAITMESNTEGFLYPKLDPDKCVECGLCNSKCPVNKYQQENKGFNPRCLLSTTKSKEFYKKSATIGVCTMLAKYIIENNGLVFGAFLDEEQWSVSHIGVNTIEGLDLIRNSKYAQSQTYQVYKDVKDSLQKKIPVLYIGTPCQVAGIKAYLNHNYACFYTIDLICHGVYSSKLLQKEIEYWSSRYGAIKNFKFRSKKLFDWHCGGVINFDYIKSNGEVGHIERPGCSSPTYYCYAYSKDGLNHNLRLSCYNCKFRSPNRYGDITVGDSWCVNLGSFRKNRFIDNINGTSLLQINTEKGNVMLSWIQHIVKTLEISQKEAYVQPALLSSCRPIPPTRSQIYSFLNKEGSYGSFIESLFSIDLDKEYKNFFKKYWKSKLLMTLKMIVKKIIS